MENTHLPALRIAPFQLLQRYPSVPNGETTAILLARWHTHRASEAGSSSADMILGVAMLVATLLTMCLTWPVELEMQGFLVIVRMKDVQRNMTVHATTRTKT